MKNLHNIRYPINRADAIHYVQELDARWKAMLFIPDKNTRHKETLKIINDAESAFELIREQKLKNPLDKNAEAAYRVLQKWFKSHWKI